MADIELVIKISEKVYNALTHTEFDANLAVDEMRRSIANGTPLVRCKDCKYNKGTKIWLDGDVTIDCDNGMGYPPPDWFCADGKAR